MADGIQDALFSPCIPVYGLDGERYDSLGDPVVMRIGIASCKNPDCWSAILPRHPLQLRAVLLLTCFYFDRDGKPREWCIPCWNEREVARSKKKREDDPEAVRARDREYRQKNLEREREKDRRWRKNNPEAAAAKDRRKREKQKQEDPEGLKLQDRSHNLRRLYGPDTPEWFDETLASQDGVCAISGQPPENGKPLVVDHDRETGMRRGLLRASINRALGFFNHDPAVLRAAADYIEHWREIHAACRDDE